MSRRLRTLNFLLQHRTLNRYCPHSPWPKQLAFLDLDCKEAFYGGAAAGGKSEALLMGALLHVHRPGYAALILRKDTQRLNLSGGLIPRSHQWLSRTGATWNAMHRRWSFPTSGPPATISFGYLNEARDKYRYGSSEYQYIAFDELTEFSEEDYLFLFSRLRKTRDISAPLCMRSASNPGNLGHPWVKQRFITDAFEKGAGCEKSHVQWKEEHAYVSARISDNPAIDEEEYRHSLSHLPPVVRERLMNGDWSVREEGLICEDWLCYYTVHDRQIRLCRRDGDPFAEIDERECRRFATVDPAGTSADRARESRGRPPSWSVLQIWETTPASLGPFLLLRHVWRKRVGFDGLCRGLREMHAAWKPARILIEGEKLGRAACDVLGSELPIECVSTGLRDKVTRAAPLLNKLERGELFLPKNNNDWLPDLQTEWLGWTGLDEETSDQIDAAAYAVVHADSFSGKPVTIDPIFLR